MKYQVISYCNNKYPDSYGGVARYDYCLSKVFPKRKFFKGPDELLLLLEYIKTVSFPIIITDNHLGADIPQHIPLIIVHHGIARLHADRDNDWDIRWKLLCVHGQDKVFKKRSPKNTWFISPSEFCTHWFNHYYDKYNEYRVFSLPHASELDENKKKDWSNIDINRRPVVLGNWCQPHKGKLIIGKLKEKLKDEFDFVDLNVEFNGDDIEDFNKRKQQIYLNSDIYLSLSSHEGNSYALLDAYLNDLLIISTNVGWTWKDASTKSFISVPHTKVNDIDLVANKIRSIWNSREKYLYKSRDDYFKKIDMTNWSLQMKFIVRSFYLHFYYSQIISKINI